MVIPILVAMLWYEQYRLKDTESQLIDAYARVQQVLIDKELEFINLIQITFADTTNLQRNWREWNEQLNETGISACIFKNDTLHLWTDNHIYLKYPADKIIEGTGFITAANGHYFTFRQKRGTYTYVFLYCLKNEYPFRNQYIENYFSKELDFLKDAFFLSKPVEGFYDVTSLAGKYLFSIQIFGFTKYTPLWLVAILVFLLLYLFALIHMLGRVFIKKYLWLTSIAFFGLFGYLRWMNIFYHAPFFLYRLKLFDPSVYASSIWFPSLGDLLIDSAIILWYLILLESRSNQLKRSVQAGRANIFSILSHGVLSFLASYAVISSIKSITVDSQISFDINNFFTINFFTYVGLVVTIIQLLSVYFINRNFARVVRLSYDSRAILILSILFASYLIIMTFVSSHDWFLAIVVILLNASFISFKSIQIKLNRFQQYFIVILIISATSAVCINHWLDEKEKEARKLYAVKLISQNDITTDFYLRNIEKKIKADEYISDYFINPLIAKGQFEKRIRQLYFTGYLSRFDVNIYDFDSAGYHFKQRNEFGFNQLNGIYNKGTIETKNRSFRYINSTAEAKSYLGKFMITRAGHINGFLYVYIKPKLIQDENRFDELLIEGYRKRRNNVQYSYAVYKDKNLVYQSGDYPYRITNTWGESENTYKFFEENDFEHLLYTDKQPLTIVVSKPSAIVPQSIGLFSFIFTFCTVTLIFVLFAYVGVNARILRKYKLFNNRITQRIQRIFNRLLMIETPEILYIRTRIQISIIFILFLTLIFSGYFTISFTTQKYNNRQKERLMKKMRNVVLAFENEKVKDMNWDRSGELEALVNQIADFYDTDISLFDKNGELIASSIYKIYDEGVVAGLIDPFAYYHLCLLKESQFIQSENIVRLNFEAAYAPVFKNKSQVLGYLQLPYFNQQVDLYAEISSVVVGFINLYVVLFIIIGVIAYLVSRNISYPLTLIQQKLSKTELGQNNEPIIWQRDDEIGELVKQYNYMITALERSAHKLAEKEREGAWREIARQIAHEIKNPLTPMKLSIQHLQRAFRNNDADLGDKINRTTQLLIQQIDTLSNLANEFSSFAKMPAPNFERLDVCEAIQQVVDLYATTDEAKIELNCKVQSELWFDRSYFNRIITNLLKNALQAIPENRQGLVQIFAYETDQECIVEVKDNGSGMLEDQAAHIFKPYFSTKISGMGLGLPIIKSMIESGSGSISFVTQKDEGTTFTIKLPKLQ
ncbi:MAG: ATP-binding protein [Bacteroidota bacterium]